MEIFIGNLSDITRERDLIRFFGSFAKKMQFRLEAKTLHDNTEHYYAIAVCDSEKLARKAIAKLDGKRLLGMELSVREFHYRSSNNERRAPGWRNMPRDGEERRVCDRRTHSAYEEQDEFEMILLEVKHDEPSGPEAVRVDAYEGLARKY